MTRNEARDYITHHPEEYLEKDRSGRGYICPICGSGSGSNGTGMSTQDKIHFTCWSGQCIHNEDILDIIGKEYSITDYNGKLEKACSLYGITLDAERPSIRQASAEEDFREVGKSDQPSPKKEEQKTEEKDFTLSYRGWMANRRECDYLTRRGISEAVQDRFMIGYAPAWTNESKTVPSSPRLIIPTGKASYIARAIRETDKGKRYINEGKATLFNWKELYRGSSAVFIVEGAIDAMSVIECECRAIGLNSTSNHEKLVSFLKEQMIERLPTFLIALDKDEAGRKTAEDLLHGLESIGAEAYTVDICGEYKDPNEYLVSDREGFKASLMKARGKIDEMREQKAEEYRKTHGNKAYLDAFIRKIATTNTPTISTGFPILDGCLDGGLREGLYFIGAISSLGKTTFLLQLADQIASMGQDVLFFSLEMSRNELIAKSVSRLTYTMSDEGKKIEPKSVWEVTDYRKYQYYSQEEQIFIEKAIAEYGETVGSHLFVIEGMGDVTVDVIREEVARHKANTGTSPVVIIDYLQIIAPPTSVTRMLTEKQTVDANVLSLKRISRDYKTPVIAISSFNRDNYANTVSMVSFKESGAIEYSSDVLIGLQYKGTGQKDFDMNKARQKEVREVEMLIIKNRNGQIAVSPPIEMDYRPKYNFYKETLTKEEYKSRKKDAIQKKKDEHQTIESLLD